MQYLALLYAAEDERSDPNSEAYAADIERYGRFDEFAGDAIVGGEALTPAAEAITIRRRDGELLVTDGPYTESTEVLGGLFVLEAEDLDEALRLAREIPAADHGAVELRPLVEWFQRDAEPDGSQRYLAVLAGPEEPASVPGSDAWNVAVAAHDRFGSEVGEAVVGGAALHPASSATTLRVRGGELLLTDGPFVETGEVVGGLYLLAAADRDGATALASRIPMSDSGAVELRRVVEFDG